MKANFCLYSIVLCMEAHEGYFFFFFFFLPVFYSTLHGGA